MDLKFLKWNLLRGSLMRRLVMRAFMLMLAIILVSLMQMARDVRVIDPIMSNLDKCPLNWDSNPEFNLTCFLNSASRFAFPHVGASPLLCKESENLTRTVFKELMEKNLLQSNAKALCVGEKSASAVLALRHLGFFNAVGVERHPFFSLFKRRFVYELNFEDNHFDFIFSEDLDRVSFPALLVLEIERVLRPGGTGAVLVRATPILSFLKTSDVVRVCGVGSFALVIFKKRLETFASFEHFQLPSSCPAVANNKPFMKHIEPLPDKTFSYFQPEPSYLPNFMNISSRNRLVYINIGAGEYAKTSVAKMSKPYCANHHAAFEVFIIDHKTSVLSSYVTDPGTHFIYDPALSGDTAAPEITSDEFLSAPMDEEGFDFVRWFKESVSDGDFVVLMMKAKLVELNILVELFKAGAICRVDELFILCSDSADCMNLIKSLRKSGVYVHKWSGDNY
ncbi:hypothetical protein CDL12_09838 [Handroanthus impetiginosus]|uniref:Uncharacterized protein n=1 Tax=Handroanthus impetiginosus TaxID=429701 RepID=A0A2G9HIY7_9LAMI|nr:hypothetical protein CDL12_09838 [Handroanthus impetiginosus]